MIKKLQQEFIESIPLLETKAIKNNWCIYNNHCLLRVIYDYIFLDDWRKHISNKQLPVYKRLSIDELKRGLLLISKLKTADHQYVYLLQVASLKWRNNNLNTICKTIE